MKVILRLPAMAEEILLKVRTPVINDQYEQMYRPG